MSKMREQIAEQARMLQEADQRVDRQAPIRGARSVSRGPQNSRTRSLSRPSILKGSRNLSERPKRSLRWEIGYDLGDPPNRSRSPTI